ncbi:ROK family transcriptional regulator [Cribrihabitans pelagius]|uniref:ROK family transcriptional regulator n=1 Tax=Cribrihabitans pelagius TaxID=1765746 RepID=UPI003B58ED3A
MAIDKVRTLSSGVNQSGVRAYNERLLLSTLLRHGALPGSEIARRTKLSPQTASVILRKLESDGLLIRGESVKGRVGKPSVPMTINPDGLFSYGLKIGRRSADLLLMDFTGGIRSQLQLRYAYPMPEPVFDFVREGMREIEGALPPESVKRICGIGVAAPFELWSWHRQAKAPEADFRVWKDTSVADEIARFSALPVFPVNDATAACRAEHTFGRGKEFRDYVYFFVGAFIGGGVVLNHSVYEGVRGNAGALGPMTVQGSQGPQQLLDVASLHVLESRLHAAGLERERLWRLPLDWSGFEAQSGAWLEEAASALAQASLAACAVIDFEAVLIDGALPAEFRARLAGSVRQEIAKLDARGLIRPAVAEGQTGANARPIGAASGPLFAQFLLDTHTGPGEVYQAP